MNRQSSLILLGLALVGLLVSGCSGSADEGSTSTATPADQLKRPGPKSSSGGGAAAQAPGASKSAGTLPEGN